MQETPRMTPSDYQMIDHLFATRNQLARGIDWIQSTIMDWNRTWDQMPESTSAFCACRLGRALAAMHEDMQVDLFSVNRQILDHPDLQPDHVQAASASIETEDTPRVSMTWTGKDPLTGFNMDGNPPDPSDTCPQDMVDMPF
jgi:hypothetical protein